MFKARPSQARVLEYRSGKLGISAVPGSGKTHILSALAAKLLYEGLLDDDQEILIVTLVNSAVDNFTNRIQQFMRSYGLIPNVGYRVRTLHGLAHDIVRGRPDLAQLANDFAIIDEKEAQDLLGRITEGWLLDHPGFSEKWLRSDTWGSRSKIGGLFHDALVSMAGNFIRVAKDARTSAQQLSTMLAEHDINTDLLEFGSDIYSEYQRALYQRGEVDFDDLIRLAMQVLEADPDYLQRLQHRWLYILEDEAQDSSRLQEVILRQLSASHGNWVRVGDPNQAIFETFTTANPEYLKNFLIEPGVSYVPLPESGRSALPIIKLANHLIQWTNTSHPVLELRTALTIPLIQATAPGDPQQNPSGDERCVTLMQKGYSPDREITNVAENIKKFIEANPDRTVAVLTTRNDRGEKMIDKLKGMEIPCLELLRSTQSTRAVTAIIAAVLACIEMPNMSTRLAEAYTLIRRYQTGMDENFNETRVKSAAEWLRKRSQLGEFLYSDPSTEPTVVYHDEVEQDELERFRALMLRWHQASILPIGQLVLLVGQDIFSNAADIGLVHKLSLLLSDLRANDPNLSIKDYIEALNSITKNQRRFLGFTDLDTGFDPDGHPGKVVVATIHKSKGLEWDRVYILSANNYDFPSAQPHDTYYSEKWYITDGLNIEAEALHQLRAILTNKLPELYLPQGAVTNLARIDYCAERLRLLYVGITRARRELVITWNTGQKNDSSLALPLREIFVDRSD